MKNYILILFWINSVFLYGQDELTKEKIDLKFENTINNLSSYHRIFIIDSSRLGEVDTTNFYFLDKELIYVNKYSCSAGLAMVEGYANEEYFYLDGCLVLIRYYSKSNGLEYGNSDQSSTSVSEELIYLKKNGECLIQFYPREAEGTRLTYMENLKKTPLKQQDCMYFAPDTKHNGDKYIKLLINQKPEYQYLLQD